MIQAANQTTRKKQKKKRRQDEFKTWDGGNI